MSKLTSCDRGFAKISAIMIVVAVAVAAVGGGMAWWYTSKAPAPTSVPLSFEEALAAARNPTKPIERWMHFEEWRRIGDYKLPPYEAADGSIGHYLFHAANGTVYEASYPEGKIGDPVQVFKGLKDNEAYYIWEIIADKKWFFVDARTGEVLSVAPAFK